MQPTPEFIKVLTSLFAILAAASLAMPQTAPYAPILSAIAGSLGTVHLAKDTAVKVTTKAPDGSESL